MAIKVIMVDVDGVIITHPDKSGWSTNLERDLGVSYSQLQFAFFDPHWEDIIHGRAGLRERLEPTLRNIKPELSYDKLVDYWFYNDSHQNERLISELGALRASGIEVHLATVQEHERANYLWNNLNFRRYFERMHYAADLGSKKPNDAFYLSIQSRTGFNPEEIFFIDDKVENVEAARACGWNAEVWTGGQSLEALLRKSALELR